MAKSEDEVPVNRKFEKKCSENDPDHDPHHFIPGQTQPLNFFIPPIPAGLVVAIVSAHFLLLLVVLQIIV